VDDADGIAMTGAWVDIAGDAQSGLLLIGDHASARVPDGIVLGVSPETMDDHVAVDIGVAPLGERLCASLGCPGILGGVSRLVIDLNREEDAPGLIPLISDGRRIPGNEDLSPEARDKRLDYWHSYHQHIANAIGEMQPKLLISLHSFTPRLATSDEPRPWEIGILYNEDERAARIALPLLAAVGIKAGDNLPYSGKILNATMNRHGEANAIPYLGIEVRQDLLGNQEDIEIWSERLAQIVTRVAEGLGR
jgi:predicted N-formylglutamate amidohydrolase